MLARVSSLITLALALTQVSVFAADKPLVISSLSELAASASKSGQKLKMKPGLYRLLDFISMESIPERRKLEQWQFIHFSGSNNTFDLTGVTLELNTELREKLRSPIHTDEFLISGSHVTLKGLTITSRGTGKAFGGAVLGLTGQGTTLENCTIHVEGSDPYGYGDLFGKGGHKHSGVHITGSQTRILGCKIFNRSFGHGFYLQSDCNDILLENCYVEGVMSSTDEMLAETSGKAFDRQFIGEVFNRSGTKRIQPGYMKALCEDAFRTYHTHQNVVLRNCTAKNMRGGFELRTKSAPRLENCTAIGCERGFWVSDCAVVTQCQGDNLYGPLLYVEGDHAKVDVTLLPNQKREMKVHALAALYGRGNEVKIIAKDQKEPTPPILIGFTPPAMGENATAFGERASRDLILHNQTAAPLIIGAKAEGSKIHTWAPVQENLGKKNEVTLE